MTEFAARHAASSGEVAAYILSRATFTGAILVVACGAGR
jgi:hypothetical protein